jgi:hypothetical protein
MIDTDYLISLIDGVMNSDEVGVDDLYADCIGIKEGIIQLAELIKQPVVVIDGWGKDGPYVTVTIKGRTFTGILTEQEELE